MSLTRLCLILAITLPAAGCEIGDPLPSVTGDGGAGDGDGGNGCLPAATPSGDGHHNPGQPCLASGCHGPGSTAPVFSVGGTVYQSDGVTPAAGATVVVGGVNIVTGTNGNFYLTAPVTFPAKTRATSCPSDQPMISDLQENGGGDCNNCHRAPGGTTAVVKL